MLLVHLCPRAQWLAAQSQGEYRAASLGQEGFIHCSRPEQILEVANRFYHGLTDLVLLWIDARLVKPDIRWEAADGELFPHLFGPLNLEAVVAVSDFAPDADGVFRQVTRPAGLQAGFPQS